MTAMQNYATRYPRSGQLAVLCEGDIAGYEADLLEQWTARQPSMGFVDVWPCGTKTAIYGISDAIGRGIPTCVIEDRDYRTVEMAQKDCKANQKDRQGRGVTIEFWRSWRRNEIENYFIEPLVVCPVFARAFATSEDIVSATLQDVIAKTATDQALQFTLAGFRDRFPKGERDVGGVSRADGRPKWSEGGIQAPERNTVERLLGGVVSNALEKLETQGRPNRKHFIRMFGDKCDEWTDAQLDDSKWRVDWAGKEILQWVRISLSAKCGWPDSNGDRVAVDWASISRNARDEKDREIEKALQPRLVKRFLQLLMSPETELAGVIDEWREIASCIEHATSHAASE